MENEQLNSNTSLEKMAEDINDQIQVQLDNDKANTPQKIDYLETSPEQAGKNNEQIDPPSSIFLEKTEQQPLNAPKKRRQPSKLQRDNAKLSDAVEILAHENERLKAETYYATQQAANAHDKELESNITLAQEAYKQAVEAGDIEAQAEAQKYIAKFTTEQTLYNQQRNTPIYDSPQPSYVQNIEEDPYDELDEYEDTEYGEWLNQNQWADPRARDFDDGLAFEANHAAEVLNKHYKTSGQSYKIGSREYLEEISGYIRNKYNPNRYNPSSYQEPQDIIQKRPYQVNTRPTSSSRTAGGFHDSNLVQNNFNPRSMRLSKEEQEIAYKIPGKFTPEQKLKMYLEHKRELNIGK